MRLFSLTGVLILLFTLLASACQEAEPEVIDEATMQAILMDIHLSDAWVERSGGTLYERSMLREGAYDEVLARHGLDRETFFRSYLYYLEAAVQLDSIYVRMVREMEGIEMEVQRQRMEQKNNPGGQPAQP